MQATARPSASKLVWPNLALVASLVFHDLDHVRQGRAIESGVVAIGILGDVIAITSLFLAIARHPVAPAAAVIVGFGTALGFVAVHIVPDWGPLSQGYPGTPVDAVSWGAAVLPMVAGGWLGFMGRGAMRARATARSG